MIGSELRVTLNALGRLLTEGDAAELASYFECPLPVYFDDKFILFHSSEKMAEAIAVYRVELARSQIRRVAPVLLRVEDTTPNRCLFVARWNYLAEDGACRSSNVVRYVARRGEVDGKMRIELVEYLEIGISGFPTQLLEVVSA